MADFKYQEHLKRCEQPCPSDKYQERSIVAYRWVHQPSWPDDWDPPALLARGGQARPPDPRKCGNYALSFYKDLRCARKRLKSLDRGYDTAALYGTHAARVQIKPTDGSCSTPNRRYGHLDLHEYEGDREWPARVDSIHLLFALE